MAWWIGKPSMSGFVEHCLSGKNIRLQLGCEAKRCRRSAGETKHTLIDKAGDEIGDFDIVLSCADAISSRWSPLHRHAFHVGLTGVDRALLKYSSERIERELAAVSYSSILCAVFHLETTANFGFDAAFIPNHPLIRWAHRENSRHERQFRKTDTVGDIWVLHSVLNVSNDVKAIDLVNAFLRGFSRSDLHPHILGEQRWPFAIPQGGNFHKQGEMYEPSTGIGCAGSFMHGPLSGVEGAWLSGRALAIAVNDAAPFLLDGRFLHRVYEDEETISLYQASVEEAMARQRRAEVRVNEEAIFKRIVKHWTNAPAARAMRMWREHIEDKKEREERQKRIAHRLLNATLWTAWEKWYDSMLASRYAAQLGGFLQLLAGASSRKCFNAWIEFSAASKRKTLVVRRLSNAPLLRVWNCWRLAVAEWKEMRDNVQLSGSTKDARHQWRDRVRSESLAESKKAKATERRHQSAIERERLLSSFKD